MLIRIRYLEEDPSTVILERRRELAGYEIYVVEQWACSRIHPTFVITTFTGLAHHTVPVGVLSVPINEEYWSPRLRVYLKAIAKFHARKKETPLGTLMVTNLSGFPSALTVIPVPGGDVRRFREEFIVNEDLKRLGCSGRAGLSLSTPTGATQAKFLQLYRTSERIQLTAAVMELVKRCQVALVMFSKLAPEYADGLLCDVTERAINNWWTEVGTEYFNVEPSDGILGPTTVAAILGMFLGARNRLNAYGTPVSKDAFDLPATKRGIAHFQKAQKLSKTRRLDRQTLDRLHRVTSKAAANSEGWTVPRAVKSTVAELGGRGGEMVMGIVGARDKTGIAEVETLEISTFIDVLSGERCKWLWHGKPRKNVGGDMLKNLATEEEMVFSGDEQAGYQWTSRKRDSTSEQGGLVSHLDHLYIHPNQGSQTSLEPSDRDQAFRKNVLRTVTGRMNDARTGLGRFKDAVGIHGLRSHNHKYSRDESVEVQYETISRSTTHMSTGPEVPGHDVQSRNIPARASAIEVSSLSPDQDEAAPVDNASDNQSRRQGELFEDPVRSEPIRSEVVLTGGGFSNSDMPQTSEISDGSSREDLQARPRAAKSRRKPKLTTGATKRHPIADVDHRSIVRRTRSLWEPLRDDSEMKHRIVRPRQLSFSIVDNTIRADDLSTSDEVHDTLSRIDVQGALAHELQLRVSAEKMHSDLLLLESLDTLWLQQDVESIERLVHSLEQDRTDLDDTYHRLLEESGALREALVELVAEEKNSVLEALKDVETLAAKLEYEVGALRSKVEDVEDGVAEYERQATRLEDRSRGLDQEEIREASWIWHLILLLVGLK